MSNNIEFEAPITVESEIKKDKKDKGLKNDIGSAGDPSTPAGPTDPVDPSLPIGTDKKGKVKIKKPGKKRRRKLLIGLGIFFLILIILLSSLYYFIGRPALAAYESFENIKDTLYLIKDDFERKDLIQLDTYISNINTELDVIDAQVDKFEFLKELSLTKGYYENLQVVMRLSEKAQILVEKTLPELKVILGSMGYIMEVSTGETVVEGDVATEGEAVVVEGDNEEKVQAVVKELPRLVELYGSIEKDILDMIEIFNELDPEFVPDFLLGDLKAQISDAQALTLEFPAVSAQIKQTFTILPTLLGSESPADYLVIFQNEKEMRASGGLLTAYGNLTVDKGEFNDDVSAVDMWALEGYVSWTLGKDVGYRNIYGQRMLMERGCGSAYLRAQDSGIYPDLYVVMDTFKDYYDMARRYDPVTYPEYDNIIILNTFLASDIVSVVEPIEMPEYGKVITGENLAKEITFQTLASGKDPNTRKSFIGDLATAVQEKLKAMPAEDLPKLVKAMIRSIQAKNLAIYSLDSQVQAYLDEFGLSARVEKNFGGDYFNLSEAQVCSLKSNFYIYDEVTQNIHINGDNTISKEVNVHWVNEKVYDPAEESLYSASSNFRYRAWIRFFAPVGTNFTGSDGYERSNYLYIPNDYYDEVMDKETYDNVIYLSHYRASEEDPIKTQDLNVAWTLPSNLNYDANTGYRLLIQKHPGKKNELYKINMYEGDSITSIEFRLERDMVVTYKDGIISTEPFDTRLDEYYEMMETIEGI